ncbi:hypothetical protein BSB_32330 [Bacillus stercoris]|nr:hypothetical protein BSB_32330 [Bacillus stercoris]
MILRANGCQPSEPEFGQSLYCVSIDVLRAGMGRIVTVDINVELFTAQLKLNFNIQIDFSAVSRKTSEILYCE